MSNLTVSKLHSCKIVLEKESVIACPIYYLCISWTFYYRTFKYFFPVFWFKITVAKTTEKQHPRIKEALLEAFIMV